MIENYSTREEALEKGQFFYVSDEECPHGHLSLRYTKDGSCYDCVILKNDRMPRRSREEQEATAKLIIQSFKHTYLGLERRTDRKKSHFKYDCGIKDHGNKSVTLSSLERAHREKPKTIEKKQTNKN